ncbi:serine hydrolase FSH [Mycena amicta]|nr:serine hydrolase FSH [Mycena amicta]
MVRVLALHGYSQNSAIFAKRLTALRETCGQQVEFVCLSGPILLPPRNIASQPNRATAFDSSDAIEANESRAWFQWIHTDDPEHGGLPESLLLLRDVLSAQHFDGVLGFSQGATMGALLTALLERPHVYPPFLLEGKAPHPPFKFCIAVSGFRLPGAVGDKVFATNFNTPTLHIIAAKDPVVPQESSQELVRVSNTARLEIHEGGHYFPATQGWTKLMAACILDQGALMGYDNLGNISKL